MGRQRHKIKEREVRGFKYFKAIAPLLESLRDVGCERDRAGNRLLHMDQYISLLLLYLFNPICTSLRSLQQASELKNVQRKLGVPRASLGSLSEAATVFDSAAMQKIIEQLGEQLQPITARDKLNDLPGILRKSGDALLIPVPYSGSFVLAVWFAFGIFANMLTPELNLQAWSWRYRWSSSLLGSRMNLSVRDLAANTLPRNSSACLQRRRFGRRRFWGRLRLFRLCVTTPVNSLPARRRLRGCYCFGLCVAASNAVWRWFSWNTH